MVEPPTNLPKNEYKQYYIKFGWDGESQWGPYASRDIAMRVAKDSFPRGVAYDLYGSNHHNNLDFLGRYKLPETPLLKYTPTTQEPPLVVSLTNKRSGK